MRKYNHNSETGAAMAAFTLGVLVGAGLALLLAPASGEETREFLTEKARESRARARSAVEQGREVYERERESIASAIDRGREAFVQARERGSQGA